MPNPDFDSAGELHLAAGQRETVVTLPLPKAKLEPSAMISLFFGLGLAIPLPLDGIHLARLRVRRQGP